jgi:hypothetical protein
MQTKRRPLIYLTLILLTLFLNSMSAQPAGFNYDESKIPDYSLPDPLINLDGVRIADSAEWTGQRRGEILELFQKHVYGRRPADPKRVSYIEESRHIALNGKAVRKQVTIRLDDLGEGHDIQVLMYLPPTVKGPVPAFLGYNFGGNQSINSDPGIVMPTSWMREARGTGYEGGVANEKSRGLSARRWPVEMIVERGYALVNIYYGDIEPDHADGWKTGIRSKINRDDEGDRLEPEDWSAISAWAWGASHVLDYLETDPAVDGSKVAIFGHSRLGKTSLWAGASDERFALTISNDSGCGGAALSRRAFGETVQRINTSFPHWFCERFKAYNNNEAALPVDQHMLIALMAPRPVYIASAEEDIWADPKGEFLSAKHAGPVYELFGLGGVEVDEQPAIHQPVGSSIGYHIRAGAHDVTDYDWEQYLNFADKHLK